MHFRSCILLLCGVASIGTAAAQAVLPHPSHEVDLSFTYTATRSNGTTGDFFWQNGGSVELSAAAFHGFGAAARASSGHATNINGSQVELNTFNMTFGPRYTVGSRRIAAFGEGLIGEAYGLDGVFPAPGGAQNSARTFALEVGGGLDLRCGRHFAVRPVEAHWLRTEFPNATTNVQNNLQLGAGLVFRLQR